MGALNFILLLAAKEIKSSFFVFGRRAEVRQAAIEGDQVEKEINARRGVEEDVDR